MSSEPFYIQSALLPCPFCGHPPSVVVDYYDAGGHCFVITIACEQKDCEIRPSMSRVHLGGPFVDGLSPVWNRRSK